MKVIKVIYFFVVLIQYMQIQPPRIDSIKYPIWSGCMNPFHFCIKLCH